MILGQPHPGPTAQDLAADHVRVASIEPGDDVHLALLSAYLDGGGPGSGPAYIRGVAYDGAGALVARGDEVVVASGQAAGWVRLPMASARGLLLHGGASVSIGLHVGGDDRSARVFVRDPGATGSRLAADTYADGTASPLPAPGALTADFPIIATAFTGYAAPIDAVTDDYLALLPFPLAQTIFGTAGIVAGSQHLGTLGWHGRDFHPIEGAVAVVRSDGPLSDLVGERVRISYPQGSALQHSIAVYVTDERLFPDDAQDEDISVPVRPYLELSELWRDALGVEVEVLA